MLILLLRRFGTAIVTLLLASFFVFFAVQALPGDVAKQLLGQNATPEAVAALREKLGLDTNVWVRYLQWLGDAVHGDLGTSLVSGNPVSSTVGTAFGHTLLIAIPAIIFGIGFSLLLGVVAGSRRDRAADSAISILSLVAMSIPEFVVATLLVTLFSIAVPIFPAVVIEGPQATTSELLPSVPLPMITLILAMAAYVIRSMRSATVDGLTTEYATTARLKGVDERRVLRRHVLPSALLPVLPVVSINVAWMLGGVVVVESVFNYPGVGKLMIDSVSTRDLPVLQAIALLSASIYVVVNFAADVVALVFDPQQRTVGRARTVKPRSEVAEAGS